MAKAITYNNAGIVEAIKRQSGSIKFYKASFQGIIEAIEDWGGGSGGTEVLPEGGNLPNTDNNEGDLVVIPDGEGNYFMYVYADGSWEKLHITTSEVMEAGSAPFSITTPDGTVLTNQQDVNIYLAETIQTISEKGYDDSEITAALEAEIQAREDGDDALDAKLHALALKISLEQAEQDKEIEKLGDEISELGDEISELTDSIFGSCEYEDKTGILVEYDGKGGIQYQEDSKKLYLNQFANMGWPEPSNETKITINKNAYAVVSVGNISGYNYFYELTEDISDLLNTEVTVSLCSPKASLVTQEEFEKDQKRQDDDIEKDQERQDKRLEEVDQASKARDLLLEAEILLINSQVNGKQKETFINSADPGDNPYPGYKIKDAKTITFNHLPWEPLPKVGDELKLIDSQYAEEEIVGVSPLYKESGPYTLIDVTLRFGVWELDNAQVGDEATFELTSAGIYVTPDEFVEDQQRQDDEIAKRVLKTGDTMTGDLKVEADVHANRIDSRVIDSGEQSNLNLQWNGATKVYVGGNDVTIQPPLQLNTEGVDQNHAVTKGYIDALDAKQAAEISTIEYKLDALLGLTFQGTYEFKHDQSCEMQYQQCMAGCIDGDVRCEQDCIRTYAQCEQDNVDPGFFEAIDPDGRFDHLQEIVISKNDKNGVEVEWASVLDAGDYLEVDHFVADSLDKTNYGLYRITEEPIERTNSKGEKVYDMKLQFLQGDGVLNQRELYEIRGITAAEGVNPEELGDFLTKNDAAALYAPKSHTHSQYASSSHAHSGTDITSGTISINRLPTGTTSSTVSKGNHTHSYLSKGTTNKYMTHKGEAGVCEFYISSGNLYWRT